MIIVKIIGGLGNQMFQYAYTKSLQMRGYDVCIDTSAFKTYTLHGGYGLDYFPIDLQQAEEKYILALKQNLWLSKIKNKFNMKSSHFVKEKTLSFNPYLYNPGDNKYIHGYFQTEKYFRSITDVLIQTFSFDQPLSQYTMDIKQIIDNAQSTCSIHIRRGDYLTAQNIKIHGVCGLDYYQRALQTMNSFIPNLSYFIFSDDISWVRQNLKMSNAIYIDNTMKKLPHEDLYLMSSCQNHIIANSSFSWWGAWLDQNIHKIVIAPKIWFLDKKRQNKDILPIGWLTI